VPREAKKKKTTKKKTTPRRRLLTTQELGETLGVGRETIQRYISQGLPIAQRSNRRQPHKFDLDVVTAWMVEHGRTGHRGRPSDLTAGAADSNGDGGDGEDPLAAFRAAKTRKEVALADVHEFKAAQLRAELILRREVVAALIAKVTVIRTRLLKLADTMPAKLVGREEREAKRILRTHFEALCRDFAKGQDGIDPTPDDVRATLELLGLD
jgi:phage terminase Nu1 subunit (DNA packaging protein)